MEVHFFYYYWCGGTKSLGTAATSGLLYKPQMIDEYHCGAIGGMKIGRGNRSTRRKPAPAPLWPPKIPLDQTRARTWAAAVGSQRLTAWAMARPWRKCIISCSGRFNHRERAQGRHLTEGWVVPKTGLDTQWIFPAVAATRIPVAEAAAGHITEEAIPPRTMFHRVVNLPGARCCSDSWRSTGGYGGMEVARDNVWGTTA
jgi:hypothetical protein